MFRVFLDAYFVLANCCNNAEFIPIYFRTDLPERLKLLNVASKHQTNLFKLVNEYATADMKGELDSKIKAEKIDAFNSYLFAQNVGCEQIYDSMYRLRSASVHTTPRCLQHYVESDTEGNVTTVLHCPDSHTTDRVLSDISWFFIKALRGVLELFEIPQSRELDDFESGLKAVVAERKGASQSPNN